MFQNKKILIGISGGIAAYKIPFFVRLLKKAGAEVKVIMTPNAKDFVTPLTLSVLSENPVWEHAIANDQTWNNHVKLGLWADAFIVAPATANTLAKMVQGMADNFLITTYLSARCPVFVAPAMDLDMFLHPSTMRNLQTLKNDGVHIWDAEEGPLASGLVGKGRMMEPENMFTELENFFQKNA